MIKEVGVLRVSVLETKREQISRKWNSKVVHATRILRRKGGYDG